MQNEFDSNIEMKSLLIKIGFLPEENGLQFDFGNCNLKVFEGNNNYFQDGLIFIGSYISQRNAGELNFFLPLQVESNEQGLALLAYNLRNIVVEKKPSWLNEGLSLSEHLPWKKEMKEYNEKPCVTIEHEWFRVLTNKIKLLVSTATENDFTTFTFDGNILKVVCNNETYNISGSGIAWNQVVSVKTKLLEFLPKRIPHRNISIFIWKNKLHILNSVYEL